MKKFIGIFILVSIAAVCLNAQHREADSSVNLRRIQAQLSALQSLVDSITAVNENSSVHEEDLEAVEERMEKQFSEVENKIASISRSTAPIILNPRITTFINFAARVDNKNVLDETGTIPIHNRPFLRTVELELGAPVDPYADAVTILSVEDEAGTGFAIDAEEAYVNIKRLPIIESAPLGVKLKIGKFRAPFGINNSIHLHDLPWTTRPLPIAKYLGTEHGEFFESGFNTAGAEADFFLPSFHSSSAIEMKLALMRSGEIGMAQGTAGNNPPLVGRLGFSQEWNNEQLLLLGVSGYHEPGNHSTQLIGADVTYKWAPIEKRESRSFVVGGELFAGSRSAPDTAGRKTTIKPFGGFAYAQYQFSYWTYFGLRYDWLQEPSDAALITKAAAAYISYYTTEFLRFRLGVEHKQSDLLAPKFNNVTSIIFDVNVVFGSHPVEPYWVNR